MSFFKPSGDSEIFRRSLTLHTWHILNCSMAAVNLLISPSRRNNKKTATAIENAPWKNSAVHKEAMASMSNSR
jgi:hypothetical protein